MDNRVHCLALRGARTSANIWFTALVFCWIIKLNCPYRADEHIRLSFVLFCDTFLLRGAYMIIDEVSTYFYHRNNLTRSESTPMHKPDCNSGGHLQRWTQDRQGTFCKLCSCIIALVTHFIAVDVIDEPLSRSKGAHCVSGCGSEPSS